MYSPGLGALHLKGFAQALVHPHSGTRWETPPVPRLDKAVCGIGILVRESLMRADDPGEAIAAFHDCVLSAS
jgi:hypothetical protein